MPIDYLLSKVVIKNFRGIESLELDLREGYPSILIGANNAGKSTVLAAIALALNNPAFYQWSPEETDFYSDPKGNRAAEFIVQVLFEADRDEGYPAVHGIGEVQVVHGVQVKGKITRANKISHRRTLLDADFNAIFAKHLVADHARMIEVPTLLLSGGLSPGVTQRIVLRLAKYIKAARVEHLPDDGHMLPITHAAEVNACILNHLEGKPAHNRSSQRGDYDHG